MNNILKLYLIGSLVNLILVLLASVIFKEQYKKAMSEIPSYYFFINEKYIKVIIIATLVIKSWIVTIQTLVFVYDILKEHIEISYMNEKENWEIYIMPSIIFYNYSHSSFKDEEKEKGFCICFAWWRYFLEIDIYF